VFDVAGDTRANLKAYLLFSDGLIDSSEDATINGGTHYQYPPALFRAQKLRSGNGLILRLQGTGLRSVVGSRLVTPHTGAQVPLEVNSASDADLLVSAPSVGTLKSTIVEATFADGHVTNTDVPDDTSRAVTLPPARDFLIRFAPSQLQLPQGQIRVSIASAEFSVEGTGVALASAGVTDLEQLLPVYGAGRLPVCTTAGDSVQLTDLNGLFVAYVDSTTDPIFAARQCAGLAGVLYAHPDPVLQVASDPNDQYYSEQWNLKNTGMAVCGGFSTPGIDIGATGAYDRTGWSHDVPVAIIDSGIDTTHADLRGTAQLDSCYVSDGSSAIDELGHGTAVAGLIGALTNNAIGVAALGSGVRMTAIKVFNSAGFGYLKWVLQGIDRARVLSMPIINMSLGTTTDPYEQVPPDSLYALNDVCLNAFLSGSLLVAAAGNIYEGISGGVPIDLPLDVAPAMFSRRVLSVGAVLPTGARWRDADLSSICWQVTWFCRASNYRPWLHLVAPGGRYITSTALGGQYTLLTDCEQGNLFGGTGFGGTSASTPLVAAAAAVVMSANRDLSGEDAWHVLDSTAVQLAGPAHSHNAEYGWGLCRADSAVAYVTAPRRVARGTLAYNALGPGGLRMVDSAYVRMYISNIPGQGIGGGSVYCWRYTLEGSAQFPTEFSGGPSAWVRSVGTAGWDTTRTSLAWDGMVDVPGGEVAAISTSMITVRTFVYHVPNEGWFPTTADEARVCWTAVGDGPTAGVAVGGSRLLDLRVTPNPGTGAVTLSVAGPTRSALAVDIFDVAGRHVRRLAQEAAFTGVRVLTWAGDSDHGGRCGSGVYFCRVRAGREELSRRFVILDR
jgi:hypothetical protein